VFFTRQQQLEQTAARFLCSVQFNSIQFMGGVGERNIEKN
jgi:hypothetical protein